MSRPFIDSNVVLYLLSADAAKADCAEAVIAAGGIISVQVLNEVTAVCRRKLKMPWQEIEAVLNAVKSACEVVPLTIASHEAALEIAKRYGLSFYDANIYAAANLAGAKVLFSEDMQDGMNIGGTVVRNPFR
ncbi:MAG: PIN domain-containing protein [Azonexus sp.]|nr:PIN domain-containing protein [Azonexus sp.]MDZ4315685.1 PIN domain-containing protein [Azonexus sp.]